MLVFASGRNTFPVGHRDALVVEPHELGVVEEDHREAGQVNDLESSGVIKSKVVCRTKYACHTPPTKVHASNHV